MPQQGQLNLDPLLGECCTNSSWIIKTNKNKKKHPTKPGEAKFQKKLNTSFLKQLTTKIHKGTVNVGTYARLCKGTVKCLLSEERGILNMYSFAFFL